MSETDQPESFMRHCVVFSRPGDDWPIFSSSDGRTIIARLDGYAIVPLERYEALTAKVAEALALRDALKREEQERAEPPET